MAADDVVGIDLEFGLGIELGVRQTASAPAPSACRRFSARPGCTMTLPWKTPRAMPIEHALEQFAAGAVRHRVIDDKRGIGMTAPRARRAEPKSSVEPCCPSNVTNSCGA